jgi:hypothetical protein
MARWKVRNGSSTGRSTADGKGGKRKMGDENRLKVGKGVGAAWYFQQVACGAMTSYSSQPF